MCENKTSLSQSELTFRRASLSDEEGILAIGVVYDGMDYLPHYIKHLHYLSHPSYICFVAQHCKRIVSIYIEACITIKYTYN